MIPCWTHLFTGASARNCHKDVLCRSLASSQGWQPAGVVRLPNDSLLDTFVHRGFSTAAESPRGICIGPDAQYRGEGTSRRHTWRQ